MVTELDQYNIIRDILDHSKDQNIINKRYGNENINIKELAKLISSDGVCEDIDTYIDMLVSAVLELRKLIGDDSETINKYIIAYLMSTELKELPTIKQKLEELEELTSEPIRL